MGFQSQKSTRLLSKISCRRLRHWQMIGVPYALEDLPHVAWVDHSDLTSSARKCVMHVFQSSDNFFQGTASRIQMC